MLTATHAGVECPRCNGQMLQRYGVSECFQCGHSDPPIDLTFVVDLASELTARGTHHGHGKPRPPNYRGRVL